MKNSNNQPGIMLRVTLMTFASIANSVVITCLLTWATLGWPGDYYYSSYAIWRCAIISAIAVPALIGPFVVWRLVSLVDDLNIAQARLARQANNDELTGLLNRRGFDSRAESAVTEAQAAQQPVSVLVCDIDRFKSINDHFGHHAGDLVIRRVGELMREVFASTEALLCRHGGEEFVALLPGLSAAQASNWAEKLRTACAEDTGTNEALPVAFTISIGVAEAPQSGPCLSELLRCADAALYEAKQNGRNRVVNSSATRLRLVASA